VALAFITALQLLPARQRAVLLLLGAALIGTRRRWARR